MKYDRTFCFFLKREKQYYVTLINFDDLAVSAQIRIPGQIKSIEAIKADGIYMSDKKQIKNSL
jgi:hypothetical protein